MRLLASPFSLIGASAAIVATALLVSPGYAQMSDLSGALDSLSRTLQQMQQQGKQPFGTPQNPNRGYQVLPNTDVPAGSGWRPSADQPIMRTRPQLPQASDNWAVCRPPCKLPDSGAKNYCVCPPFR